MDWIGDNFGTMVGAVIGLLGVVAALWIAFWQSKPKRLDYEIRNNVPILSSHASALRGRMSVLFEGKHVDEPRLVTVRIKNTGKQAVTVDDYVDMIRVKFEKNPPFDGFIADESIPGICTDVFDDLIAKVPAMRPPLLNPGDWFDVQLISDGPPGEIEVTSRFKEQSRPMRRIVEDQNDQYTLPLAVTARDLLCGVLSHRSAAIRHRLEPVFSRSYLGGAYHLDRNRGTGNLERPRGVAIRVDL